MGLVHTTMRSPVGELKLVAGERGLVAILWENDGKDRVPLEPSDPDETDPVLATATRQLGEYFTGSRRSFDIELDFHCTPFQLQVWNALLAIPYGETRSYGQIAVGLGDARAVRAVGAANGRNPISIIAPCHRVIGASGKLTGFAGGLEAKAFLLDLEAGQASPRLL